MLPSHWLIAKPPDEMTDFVWTPAESRFVDLAGVRLETACHGPSPGVAPTLVLLHEGLGCVALWRDFPEKLAAETGLGVFAYSRAGYGRSDTVPLPRPLDYMTREACDVLPRLLDAIGFRRGVLIGHSDGASIAAIYAGVRADARLAGQVLIAPHFFAEPEGLQAIAKAEQAFVQGDLREKLSKYHADVDAAFWGWNRAWLDTEFQRWSIAEYIDRWTTPTLAIQGDNDPYGTMKQIDEITRRARAPVESLVLPGCGHAPQFERREATLAAIVEFCGGVDAAAPKGGA
jgi:pimeloyl-ACP methyl ester carboxylesterase